ncbi:hypothetical protein CEXT_445841 [Caerostris extrusa]|uniref:Uncharacterized protein n=1 Tax=Caerostris extrusa TaxID=172846 RepID=A0AAV4USZ2_CAEEX|nr:hypothetical protein CEXT_445841 [Caerostris extrusa]
MGLFLTVTEITNIYLTLDTRSAYSNETLSTRCCDSLSLLSTECALGCACADNLEIFLFRSIKRLSCHRYTEPLTMHLRQPRVFPSDKNTSCLPQGNDRRHLRPMVNSNFFLCSKHLHPTPLFVRKKIETHSITSNDFSSEGHGRPVTIATAPPYSIPLVTSHKLLFTLPLSPID